MECLTLQCQSNLAKLQIARAVERIVPSSVCFPHFLAVYRQFQLRHSKLAQL